MRLLVHDYAGHPFQVQLSRALARRGHDVRHAYCASLQTTPRGALAPQPDDPASFSVSDLRLARPLEKYAFVTRWRQENEYGRLISEEVAQFAPDVVISGNAPLDAQRRLLRACRGRGVPFVYWVQDLLGLATHRLLREKIPVLGEGVGRYYAGLERRLLRQSDHAVLITEDFVPLLRGWGLAEEKLSVIENWAPLDKVPPRPADNAWARAHGLAGKTCLLYSGTLGMKHNPELLLRLALDFRDREDVRVVVVSQGLGADWLDEQKATHGLDNLVLLGFQPFEDLPDVLATGAVLLAVLEADAGVFSVPSKVLTYLCAARPLLLAVPPENLAARLVQQHDAGRCVPPDDADAFARAAADLLNDDGLRDRLGRNARAYAERAFALDAITDAFEAVFHAARSDR